MFTDTYLPARDGVVTSIMSTRKQLQSMGHDVFLFAPAPKFDSDRQPDVHYFRAKAFSRYQGYTIPMFPTDKCHILTKLNVEVIHTHGLLFQALRSMFAGRSMKLPVVITWHTMVTDAAKYYNFTMFPDWMVDLLMWRYLVSLLNRAECIVAPTESIRQELLKYAPNARCIEVVPTGIDCDRFNPNNSGKEMRGRLGLMPDEKMVLTVGRVAWEKNLDLVLKGFADLRRSDPKTRLVVAGNGPAMEHYQKMAKDLGIWDSTTFTGFVSDDDLPGLYSACDAFTIASKFETQGLVLLEAMATAKPVVGIDFRAVGELIEDGKNGYKFTEDPKAWSEATLKALGAGQNVLRNARTTAEAYSIESGATKLLKIYAQSIESKKARS
ncbi:MAG: UDP-D-galactose:(glucosyl)lipopolysaccharide-1,6-D-galactosyltransferase [Methanomassiliicoccales archaeon PtaU1.Bin124]|nr:MAG: UDP-D-galactose:(glucosyl)lipopolysaccharide-1,6-D-galactosyltransferase [Methanomassiliicoccales archaeon PtaU1.Bin124]